MPSKDGWTNERDHDKITLGKKQYRNMEEWSRPCAVCGEKFSIFVRAAAGAVNASFGLRTCKEHRGQKTGAAGVLVSSEQVDELKKELAEAYEVSMNHMQEKGEIARKYEAAFAEIQALKAELHAFKSKHELGPAMEAAKNNSKIFPWGVDSP
jgi:hypothetical protein